MLEPHPSSPLSLAGIVLAGRYELRAMLGRGGMGEVYESADRRLDRTVAVKVLLPELAADRRFVARFHREARTAARLSHPRIVAVYDQGEHEGQVFIVMEFVPGATLTDVARTGEPLRAARVARIGAGVAEALAHAHARGIVHRDVAPGNVMLDEADRVKVLDFGIARAARGSGTGAGASSSATVHGTVAYAAPEVLRGERGDQRVDIYGLGAVLYELLTGVPPFRGSSERDIERRLAVSSPVRPRAWVPSVPESLEGVVLRCLSNDAAGRPADAARIADELRALALELPPDAILTPIVGAPRASTPTATTTHPRGGDTRVLHVPASDQPGRRRMRPRPLRALGSRARQGARVALSLSIVAVVAGGAIVAIPSIVSLTRPVDAVVQAPEALAAPADVTGQSSCNGWMSAGASISWQPVARATGYEVWRRGTSEEQFSLVATVDGSTTGIRDDGLGIGATYRYRVRAMDGGLEGAWSAEIEGSTPTACFT